MAYKTNVKTYTNPICPICGQPYHANGAGAHCRKYEGCVCMQHCIECKHQKDWRCLYRREQDPEKLISDFYRKNGMKKPPTAATESGNKEITRQLNNRPLRYWNNVRGIKKAA